MNIVWWIKRDLRLTDNAALTRAVAEARVTGGQVLPLFCHEPSLVAAPDTSPMHTHAWCQGIVHLRKELRKLGADLFISEDEVVPTLDYIRMFFPFTKVIAHEEIGQKLTYDRDLAVASWCRDHGVAYHEVPQSSVQRGGINRDRLGLQWHQRIVATRPLAAVTEVPQGAKLRARCVRTVIPTIPGSRLWQPVTEAHAHKTLTSFLDDRGFGYSGGISSPNTALHHGSRLSTHLAWGTLSIKQVFHATTDRLAQLANDTHPDAEQWRRSLRAFLAR